MPQPVAVFLRQSLMLKAAIAACLDDPRPKPVHQLRATTRRLEATLELLSISTNIPRIHKHSRPLRKALRRIRRAAGSVRDLDVHRGLLHPYGRNDCTSQLDKKLTRSRRMAADKLQKRLTQDQDRLHDALDDLENTLKPALDLDLSGGSIVNIAWHWLATSLHDIHPEEDVELHTLRKACKTARYLAEIGIQSSKAAATLTTRLERVQQATGAWHDHLVLLAEARASLSKDSPLIQKIQADAGQHRRHAESMAKRLLANLLEICPAGRAS